MQSYTGANASDQPMRSWSEPVKPRIFLPEVVRRELGADSVYHNFENGLWRLTVWFGRDPLHGGPDPDSVHYTAHSDQGFTTEEAIDAIRQQQPKLPPD